MNTVSSHDAAQNKAIESTPGAKCPECDGVTSIVGNMVLGQQLRCQHCGAVLEIVALSPVLVDYAFIAPLTHHQTLLSE
ncbi:MAG: hypothetical protein PVF49_05315 [Anaerolineales bacterium]|jgi:lysine biosynthesis protein LysW